MNKKEVKNEIRRLSDLERKKERESRDLEDRAKREIEKTKAEFEKLEKYRENAAKKLAVLEEQVKKAEDSKNEAKAAKIRLQIERELKKQEDSVSSMKASLEKQKLRAESLMEESEKAKNELLELKKQKENEIKKLSDLEEKEKEEIRLEEEKKKQAILLEKQRREQAILRKQQEKEQKKKAQEEQKRLETETREKERLEAEKRREEEKRKREEELRKKKEQEKQKRAEIERLSNLEKEKEKKIKDLQILSGKETKETKIAIQKIEKSKKEKEQEIKSLTKLEKEKENKLKNLENISKKTIEKLKSELEKLQKSKEKESERASGFEIPQIDQISNRFLITLGTTLRGLIPRVEDTFISLLPVGTEERYAKSRVITLLNFLRNWAVVTALLLIILFGGVYFLVNKFNSNIEKELAILKARPITEELQEIKKKAIQFNENVVLMQSLEKEISPFSKLFEELDRNRVSGVIFTGLEARSFQTEITLKGIAEKREDLLNFKENLTKSEFFTNVELPTKILEKAEDISFTIKFKIK